MMGIVNVTPDSFSDGGRFLSTDDAVAHALALVEQGADILDVGGESSRPRGRTYGKGSAAVDEEEELRRLLPVVTEISRRTDVPVCVDTYKASVAEAALGQGAQMINDISGLRSDSRMASVVAAAGCPVVLMHMRGTPSTTNSLANYRNLLSEVHQELTESMQLATAAGVQTSQIILDPGLGFGKVTRHNLQLLRRLSFLRCLSGRPVLVGPSRKAFIGDVLGGAPVEAREWGTAGAVAAAVMAGADFVRVHDVSAMRDVVRVAEAVRREKPSEGERP
jgi:dihydropteroate synthase